MRDPGGHLAILVGAGIAANLVCLGLPPRQPMDGARPHHAAMVITLPARQPTPVAKPQFPQELPVTLPQSGEPGSLVRQLQGALKRVGCYDGDVDGVWGSSSRLAMKAFTERVNAKLPIDKPDHILLALVQGHRDRVCKGPERAEAQPAAVPVPQPVVPPPRLVSPPTEVTRRATTESPAPVPAPMPRTYDPREAAVPEPQPATRETPSAAVRRLAPQSDPGPVTGIPERRGRATARRAPSQQIAYARTLFRSLQRAATSALPRP